MRLFLAVNFPNSVRDQIWKAVASLHSVGFPVRWVQADLLHLTLKFLGEVAPAAIPDIETAVADLASQTRQFSMGIMGAGTFPTSRRPHTLWVGCETVPGLELLQHGIEKRCEMLGFPISGKPFRPHITVGRVRRSATQQQLLGLDRELECVDLEIVAQVTSMELMESILGRSGPSYRIVWSKGFVT